MTLVVDQCSAWPQVSLGLARLASMAFRNEDLAGLARALLARTNADRDDAAGLLDLGTIHFLKGQAETGLAYHALAFAQQRLFRDAGTSPRDDGVRLLAFAAPGDLMANVPVSFLLEASDIRLDILYVVPGRNLPDELPDHDLAMVIIGESDDNRPILELAATYADLWPRQPVLNDPRRVMALARPQVSAAMAGAEGICMPGTVLVEREALARLSRGEVSLRELVSDGTFPVIVRPRDSHAGRGLARLDDASAIAAYLNEQVCDDYYLSSYIDYAGTDGLFRKYRVALIDGRPYICHLAVSSHWMVNYFNADMVSSEAKRAEEAHVFATFDDDFARRHRAGFQALAERIGLDYFATDCSETADGRLLIFEADSAMLVHAMDPPDIFPYKPPQMRRIFAAFQDMLRAKAGKPVS